MLLRFQKQVVFIEQSLDLLASSQVRLIVYGAPHVLYSEGSMRCAWQAAGFHAVCAMLACRLGSRMHSCLSPFLFLFFKGTSPFFVDMRMVCTCLQTLPMGASVIAVHACGGVTDACLDIALHVQGKFAVMPCCYGKPVKQTPPIVHAVLGRGLAQVRRRFVYGCYEVS